jgi:N-acetylglucosamine-6-phosphate deacetylase
MIESEGKAMIIKDALIFYEGTFQALELEFIEDVIIRVGEDLPGVDWISLEGRRIIPGLIDIHTHGRKGLDFSNAEPDEIGRMCTAYAECGVTSVLATTMTMEYGTLKNIMRNNKAAIDVSFTGSRILGINLEGPFLGADRKGCHDEQYLMDLKDEIIEELDHLSGNNIKLLDLDPNLSNSLELIQKFSKRMAMSLAHTSASYDLACQAVQAGATHVTHLFNAMNSLHHREPGLIGMVSDLPVNVELICDGIHVHPAIIRMMFRLLGDRLVLVSDSMSAAGLGEGEYELGGLKVFVKEKKATLSDGTIAGSTTNLLEEVKNVVEFGVPIEQAILAATRNPARAIRVDHMVGELQEGKKADFLVVSPKIELEQVFIGGKRLR